MTTALEAVVTNLEENGYGGWYVLERDVMLDEKPNGEGPVAEVRSSREHLRGIAS
jgi:inosose dehydratase